MNRKKKTFINIFVNVLSQLLIASLALFTTRVIKKSLGFEYMGLNGVFTNIIAFLNLSELGIGVTIGFSLYKPIAEKNNELILSILQFLKKAYTLISIFIFITGLCLIPFLNIIVKTSLSFSYVVTVYIIFLFTTCSSYLFTYRYVFVNADQKNYVLTLYRLIFEYITKILQLIFFLATKSYILFLIINLITNIIKYILVNLKILKIYPFLKTNKKYPISKDTKNTLITKIKAMFMHSFGKYVVNSTDNLLISILVSIISAGKYAGYCSVNNLVMGLTNTLFDAVTPGVGNYINTESKDSQRELFNRYSFITKLLYMFIPVCLTILIEPFISWWLGEDTLLPRATAICIGIISFLNISRKPIISFKDAAGLVEPDKYAPIVEGILNLVISIIGGKLFGIPGILMGTILSMLLVPFWIQPMITFKYIFKESALFYILNIIKDFIITALIYFIIFNIQNRITLDLNLITLILKFLVTISLNLLFIYLLNLKKINIILKKYIFFKNKQKE